MEKNFYERLVSQDRLIEVPYGKYAVATEQKLVEETVVTEIYASNGAHSLLMGVYPTAGEALAALEDLRNPDECHDGYFYFPEANIL